MNNTHFAGDIKSKALAIGYSDCGIIPLEEMAAYDDAVARRVARFPESAASFANHHRSLPNVTKAYPWAKSVVICVRRYGKYRIPGSLQGIVGKYYLADNRHNPASPDNAFGQLFEEYLRDSGLRTACDRDFGIIGCRWAAMRAGLGVVRKNNFFYTEHGSWVNLDAWLIDSLLELKESKNLPKCPDGCSKCVQSCPTRSLAEPYMMNRESCVSNLTTWKGRDLPREKHRVGMGQWLYGCDACQDVCPHNKGKWSGDELFPGLEELAALVDPMKIVAMDYAALRDAFAGKFFYIKPDDGWKWKVNALNAMLNGYCGEFRPVIEAALGDAHEKVREMAQFVLGNLPEAEQSGLQAKR